MPVLEKTVGKERAERTRILERVLCLNQVFQSRISGKIVFGRGEKVVDGTLIYRGEGYGICQTCKHDSKNGKCKGYMPIVMRYFRVSNGKE